MKNICLIILISATFFHAGAEVYLFGPDKQKNGASVLHPEQLPGMDRKPRHTLPVEVNGKRMNLEIFQIRIPMPELLRMLKTRFAPESLTVGDDYIKLTCRTGRDSLDRWLITNAGATGSLTAFRLPSSGRFQAPLWPSELPALPPGTNAEMIVKIPSQQAIYGSFNGSGSHAHTALSSYSARLATLNWQPIGAEGSASIRGKGELLIRSVGSKQEILWLNFSEKGNGAFFYKRVK